MPATVGAFGMNPPVPHDQWFYIFAGAQHGPVDLMRLGAMVADGSLPRTAPWIKLAMLKQGLHEVEVARAAAPGPA